MILFPITSILTLLLNFRIIISIYKGERKIHFEIEERKFNNDKSSLKISNKLDDIYQDTYTPPPVIIFSRGKVYTTNLYTLYNSI